MNYLNLGCGSKFVEGWVNIDNRSISPHVQIHDLRQGIPCPDNHFSFVYHSHLLEHFSKNEALAMLRECYRVLCPGGLIRVVVPDLEQIVKIYLESLEKALLGDIISKQNYAWIMLELYDQAIRNKSGGSMLEYLKQDPVPNEEFIIERIGMEAKTIIKSIRNNQSQRERKSVRIRYSVSNYIKSLRDTIIKILLGSKDYKALAIGRFRMEGEIHQWMYDRYSLSSSLHKTGFTNNVFLSKNWMYVPAYNT